MSDKPKDDEPSNDNALPYITPEAVKRLFEDCQRDAAEEQFKKELPAMQDRIKAKLKKVLADIKESKENNPNAEISDEEMQERILKKLQEDLKKDNPPENQGHSR